MRKISYHTSYNSIYIPEGQSKGQTTSAIPISILGVVGKKVAEHSHPHLGNSHYTKRHIKHSIHSGSWSISRSVSCPCSVNSFAFWLLEPFILVPHSVSPLSHPRSQVHSAWKHCTERTFSTPLELRLKISRSSRSTQQRRVPTGRN